MTYTTTIYIRNENDDITQVCSMCIVLFIFMSDVFFSLCPLIMIYILLLVSNIL